MQSYYILRVRAFERFVLSASPKYTLSSRYSNKSIATVQKPIRDVACEVELGAHRAVSQPVIRPIQLWRCLVGLTGV